MTTTDALPVSEKELAFDALRRMPETATLIQMSEELAILASIRRGEAAADVGDLIPHDEAVRRAATWTTK